MVKWISPGKGVAPSLPLGVVAIEKGAFWSLLTMVVNFSLLTINKDIISFNKLFKKVTKNFDVTH